MTEIDAIGIETALKKIEGLMEQQIMTPKGLAIAPNTIILNSSNLQQTFDFTLYYDFVIWVNGSPTSDIVVNINVPVNKSIAGVSYIKLNTTQTKYRLKGIKLNSLSVSSTTISTYDVYVTYLAYYEYRRPELSA